MKQVLRNTWNLMVRLIKKARVVVINTWNWLNNSPVGHGIQTVASYMGMLAVRAFAYSHATWVTVTVTEAGKAVSYMVLMSTLPVWGQWLVLILFYALYFWCVYQLIQFAFTTWEWITNK